MTSARIAAFFDCDGTLADSNIVRSWFFFAHAGHSAVARKMITARHLPRLLACKGMDAFNRTKSNEMFYRLYRTLSPGRVEALAQQCAQVTILDRLYEDMATVVQSHRARGHAVVIVSGSLGMLIEPVARHLGADHYFAVNLEMIDGRYSGRVIDGVLSAEAKAAAVTRIAAQNGYDLGQSFAYADHVSDLAFLRTVATPVACRPDDGLLAEARNRGWQVIGDKTRTLP